MDKVKRDCLKCGSYIPWRITIDGKERHLQRRKFCLVCSPFGSHNTRSDFSKPKARKKYYEWDQAKKDANKASTIKRGRERKDKLIALSGGKCIGCGYNRYRGSMSFHHTDPSAKCFGLSIGNLWSKPWETILKEHAKCVLLCLNCHQEVEAGIRHV